MTVDPMTSDGFAIEFVDEPLAMKRCHGCGRELPLTRFYRAMKSRDGLQTRCKDCDNARSTSATALRRRRDADARWARMKGELTKPPAPPPRYEYIGVRGGLLLAGYVP